MRFEDLRIKPWGLLFSLFFLSVLCFAYDIEPYPGERFNQESVLNLVFSGLHYRNKDDFSMDIGLLIQKLKRTRPFDESIERIRFYYIALSKEEENLIFKEAQNFPPLKVRSDFLADISTKLNGEYKLIIIDTQGSVSCAELSYVDRFSLIILGKARYKDKAVFSKGFLHELGHALGLRDECVDCQQLSSSGPPNCAADRQEAEKLWGNLAGKDPRVNYISGCCGNKSYIRPTIASLMNDPDKAEDFGPINERYLREALTGKK